jgi:molybdenum cofactor biosynthesis enzyme MoaA
MKLEDIGFYTLTDERAKYASMYSPLQRCEMVLTPTCNFDCPYCWPIREDCQKTIHVIDAHKILRGWIDEGLRNVRFSGGEPTLYRKLPELIQYCADGGVKGIAISTNGSADWDVYEELIHAGANDFSVSLDACCSSTAKTMSGKAAEFDKIVSNIMWLARMAYTSVGVVLTNDNVAEIADIVKLADDLGVADVRVIPVAEFGKAAATKFPELNEVDTTLLERFPILKYRLENAFAGNRIRGIQPEDTNRCPLVLDDIAVAGDFHFPCIIYFRQMGDPIGSTNQSIKRIREERFEWFRKHDTQKDRICSGTCLDVCVAYNNRWQDLHNTPTVLVRDSNSMPVVPEQLQRPCTPARRSCDTRSNSCCNSTHHAKPYKFDRRKLRPPRTTEG